MRFQVRKLFATLLMSNSISKPEIMCNLTWELLANGKVHARIKYLNLPGMIICYNNLVSYLNSNMNLYL